jgi:putative glutamine amidotransferase
MSIEAVYNEEAPRLRRRLQQITGDPETAEDLAQEAFIRAWRGEPAGAERPVIGAWLHRTATNLALDEVRRRSRRPTAQLDEDLHLTAPGADSGEARAALADISPHERLVLLLRFEAGLSLRELAGALAISEEAARKRVSRARRRFAAAYREHARGRTPLIVVLLRGDSPEPYRHWLEGAGARVRIEPDGVDARTVGMADGLVVSGSATDIHPAVYGESQRAELYGDPSLARDRRDLAALRAALASDMPVLGVCSGHQLLNIISGGTLWQDLETDRAARVAHGATEHRVRTNRVSVVRTMLGREAPVPSDHHQAIRRIGAKLRPSAVSPDGVVEAIERTDRHFALGVQWHPELAVGSTPSNQIADNLVEHAARRAA